MSCSTSRHHNTCFALSWNEHFQMEWDQNERELTTPSTFPLLSCTMFSAISVATLSWASIVDAPKCGVQIAFGCSTKARYLGGSLIKFDKTSPIIPLPRPRWTSQFFTIGAVHRIQNKKIRFRAKKSSNSCTQDKLPYCRQEELADTPKYDCQWVKWKTSDSTVLWKWSRWSTIKCYAYQWVSDMEPSRYMRNAKIQNKQHNLP